VYVAALIKTAQQSGNSSGKFAVNFFPGISSFEAFANEVTVFLIIFLSTTHLFPCILFISMLDHKLIFCSDTQISSPHISRILTNKALPFFVTVPAPFLVLCSSHNKILI